MLRSIVLVQLRDCVSRMVQAATLDRAVCTPPALADPAVWFGPEDVARLRNWKDHKILGMEVLADLLAKSLPTVAPPPDDVARDFNVPVWVLARVEPSVERFSVVLGDRA